MSSDAASKATTVLAAAAALALAETAFILSQPGAATGAPADLLILVTWLAVPYGAALALIGLIVGFAISRIFPGHGDTAFLGSVATAGIAIWLRGIARLPGDGPERATLEIVLLVLAVAGGAAVALFREAALRSGRRDAIRIVPVVVLAGLAMLVIMSRNVPGPFGRSLPPPALGWRLLAALIAGAAAGGLMRGVIARTDARRGAPGRFARWFPRVAVAGTVAWIAVAGFDFARMISRGPAIDARARAVVPAGSVHAAAGGDGDVPSVILISIDTLRADHLGCYGYGKSTSPHIDQLAAEGILYRETASTSSFTLPTHASMMTGLFPSSHGATYQNRDPDSFLVRGMSNVYPTMAEILREAGYETAGFISGPLLSRQFGFARGFGLYDDRYDRLQSTRARLLARSWLFGSLYRAGLFVDRDLDSQRVAEEVNPLVETWLAQRGGVARPFFLFVHYWDPHGPYEPPSPLNMREDGTPLGVPFDMDRLLIGDYTLTPGALADTIELYDREIQYVDRHVGKLLETLEMGGWLDKAIVFLTSDHGESFGEHGHWEHSRVLYDDLLRVPFIVRLPGGRAAGTVVEDLVAQPTDILPTVLSLIGLEPPALLEGRDLLADVMEGEAGVGSPGFAFAELRRNVDWPERWGARYDRDLVSARTLRHKLIRSSTGEEELYDLESDPGETMNLIDREPEIGSAMRAILEAWRQSLTESAGDEGRERIDEGLKENLRGLGYVQ